MKLSIVIPAYNEEKRIGKTLEEYLKYFKELKKSDNIDFEIVVVINCSTDKTEDIVKNFSKKNSELKYFVLKQKGKGIAIIEGFKDSLKRKNDLIGFVDADMATSPCAYYDLIKNIGNYDGIIGSRYIKGSVVSPKQSFKRIIASRIFNTLIRLLFFLKYNDTQCGAKIFKREAIEKNINLLIITRWAFDVDLLYNLGKNNFKIREYPTVWSDKEYSHVNFLVTGPKMALAIIRLRLINSKFKDFIRLYDKLPEKLKIHKS